MSTYPISSRRPLDLSVIITLVVALILPMALLGGYSVMSRQKEAYADYKGDPGVNIPSKDELMETYKDNVALTKLMSSSKQNSDVLGTSTVTSVTTGRILKPGDARILDVPYKKQIHSLSCEFASVEMILNYFGTTIETQDTLLTKLGYALPIKAEFQGEKMVWGDPDKGFVGAVDGRMFGKDGLKSATGWGTHKGPVESLLRQFYSNSYAGTGSVESLKKNLDMGRPVIIWHVRDDASTQKITYSTPEGKQVELKQYHVALVVGYSVEVDGQLNFVINDPLYGIYKAKEPDLTRMWSKHDFDMVVGVK